jgi:flagella basal body P-ring formation protein FlgA
VNLPLHQFTGYGLVAVTRVAQQASRAANDKEAREALTADTRRATERVERALAEYLRSRGAEPGKIDFQLSEAQVRAVVAAQQPLVFGGGMPPWTRQQRMELTVAGPEGEARSSLDVRISTSTNVVVPLRAIARGAVVHPEDVQLSQITSATAATREMPCSLEQVVGRETTRAVPEGKPLESDALRSPPLVRRGEVVTVFAQAPGLKVKTMARARDDAGLGEQVTLESIRDRQPMLGRVVGFQEVEAIAAATPPRSERSTTARGRRPTTHATERTSR